jgi:hypothetical protein
VYTALSLDASTRDTRNRPRDAYRFAKGEPMGIQPYDDAGVPQRTIRLGRPLDFAAVTDHAEVFGEVRICQTPGMPGHDSSICRLYRWLPRVAFYMMNGDTIGAEDPIRYAFCGPEGRTCLDAARGPWTEVRDAAEQAYDRSSACRFTSFVAYEWSLTPGTVDLHRNVIFRNAVVPGCRRRRSTRTRPRRCGAAPRRLPRCGHRLRRARDSAQLEPERRPDVPRRGARTCRRSIATAPRSARSWSRWSRWCSTRASPSA